MALKELSRESYCQIYLDETEGWLHVNWTGYQTVESVKRNCEEMLVLMVQHKAFRVLNDNTNVLGIWSGAAAWGASSWFPRMHAAGLTHFAWVYSPSRFSQISTDATLSLMDAESTGVRVFYEIEDAKAWLRLHAP
ncbi:MAG TPA: STAS/SEC14 domain-containing protein [Abditibacteriaceae bacterium]|jgi:hypothetical protein